MWPGPCLAQALYKVAGFSESADKFLQLVAAARGKLKKGGTVDVQVGWGHRGSTCCEERRL